MPSISILLSYQLHENASILYDYHKRQSLASFFNYKLDERKENIFSLNLELYEEVRNLILQKWKTILKAKHTLLLAPAEVKNFQKIYLKC